MIELPDSVALFVEPCFRALATKSSKLAKSSLFDAVSSDALPAAINSINSFSNNVLCRERRLTKRAIITSES